MTHEQTRKSEYHRGYEDGRRSMDAEHYAVALRLRRLPLDGDTTENLSQIAKAVWHSDFGWTQDACSALRDELVRLMGGVSVPDATLPTYDELGNERRKAVCERDNLLELLRDARDEYKMLDQMLAETSANFHAMRDRVWGLQAERDGLQAKLDRVRDAMRDVERGMASAWEAADEVGR